MAAQKGKDLLLKVDTTGTGRSRRSPGLRSRTLAFNAATVDITHTESAGRWRELLAGAGVKSARVAGAGIFKDAASDETVRSSSSTAPSALAGDRDPGLRHRRGAVPDRGARVRRPPRRRGHLRDLALDSAGASFTLRRATLSTTEAIARLMANRHRGEIEAILDGAHTLCLTLGALAELEHAFGDEDMLALAERFEPRPHRRRATRSASSARACAAAVTRSTTTRLRACRPKAARPASSTIVARLLAATFGGRGAMRFQARR